MKAQVIGRYVPLVTSSQMRGGQDARASCDWLALNQLTSVAQYMSLGGSLVTGDRLVWEGACGGDGSGDDNTE